MRIILILLLLTTTCFAGNLKSPPPQEDSSLYDFLLQIKNSDDNILISTTNPDGTTPGKVGDMILYNNSGTYYLEICVDSTNKTWVGVVLTDTP